MAERLFGTDGIRGRVNKGAIRPANFVRFGEALGYVLRKSEPSPKVLIGRDTRASGNMIQAAIEAGLFNAGVNVLRAGVLPTPAVGRLTSELDVQAGLMITASHNPAHDNGVKVFGANGFKLSAGEQEEIEDLIQDESIDCFVSVGEMGHATTDETLAGRYVQFAINSLSNGADLTGLKICVDAANGAGSGLAEQVFSALGVNVLSVLGSAPNGENINDKCGALHPEALQKAVLDTCSDLGLAFDGDADRIVLVDEKGGLIDGDQIMGAIALHYAKQGKLAGNKLVATIMSNMGLELALEDKGITLERTRVGDRYVVERMREGGFTVGGEQSGHIVLTDHVTTGDAIIAGVKLMEIVAAASSPTSEVLRVFDPVPQVTKNVRFESDDPLSHPGVTHIIDEVRGRLGRDGRIVVRKSGTEPLIRVMAEAISQVEAERAAADIVSALETADKSPPR